MKPKSNKYKHREVTEKIIGAFYNVYNALGYGFLEKVYENALLFELNEKGMDAKQQMAIKVHYKGNLIGEYFADIVVNNKVIVEIKATEELHEKHTLQLINYLKATDFEVGLLLNFGEKPKVVRKIFTNQN
ncbi:MAG: GxxExxY protein [Candidatus Marinimicrobia bacterium]|nr:GxxExxY protein [Candidatus Neomarinimicrobiota bacterium]MCF7829439.1 GxxExxY protein [Candidatus Neomarinimicrobiota bacterium]MCF7880925.1 GxxExxY protein [Candidatus Neomarinimicrobiota bacterium]